MGLGGQECLTLRNAGLLPVLQHIPPEDNTSPLKAWYTNANAAALSGLISAVQHLSLVSEVYRCVEHPWGARLAWFLIKDRYLGKTSLSLITLTKRLSSFSPFPGEKMDQFLQRAQDLKDAWVDYDLELEDSKLVTQIMTVLPYSLWTQLRLTQDNLITISFHDLCTQLRKENTAREAAPATTSPEYRPLGWTEKEKPQRSAAHSAQGQSWKEPNDYHRKSDAGGRNGGKGNQRQASRSMVCFHCKKVGHAWTQCRTLSAGWKPSDKDVDEARALKWKLDGKDDQKQQLPKEAKPQVLMAKAHAGKVGEVPTTGPGAWIVDTGATHHMTSHQGLLSNITSSTVSGVEVADGRDLVVHGMGDLHFEGPTGPTVLQGVLWVPDLDHSLLSVNQVYSRGGQVTFTTSGCQVFSAAGLLCLEGVKEDNSWIILIPSITLPCSLPSSSDLPGRLQEMQEEDSSVPTHEESAPPTSGSGLSVGPHIEKAPLTLWHARLGHLGWSQLQRGFKQGLFAGVEATGAPAEGGCVDCFAGKMCNSPFYRTGGPQASAPLNLIHMDLIGPIDTLSIRSSSRYILTMLDDKTRYCWVYFLRTKDEAPAQLRDFVLWAERQYSGVIKIFRSDQGTEFTTHKLGDWLRERGIEQQYSIPSTPEQNGAAEKLNRTLLDRARTMLLASGLTPGFWEDAVRYAAWVTNRVPSSILPEQVTPYQEMNGRVPKLSMARTFGTMAHVWLSGMREKRTKFGPKATWGVVLGLSSQCKGWEFYLPDSRKHGYVARTAKFHEDLTYQSWMQTRGVEIAPAELTVEQGQSVWIPPQPSPVNLEGVAPLGVE